MSKPMKLLYYAIGYIVMAGLFLFSAFVTYQYERSMVFLILGNGLVWASMVYPAAGFTNSKRSLKNVAWLLIAILAILPLGGVYNHGGVTLVEISQWAGICIGAIFARFIQEFIESGLSLNRGRSLLPSARIMAAIYLLTAWSIVWSCIYFFFRPFGHPADNYVAYVAILVLAPFCFWLISKARKALASDG